LTASPESLDMSYVRNGEQSYPFITQGDNPIQGHDGVGIASGCFVPSGSVDVSVDTSTDAQTNSGHIAVVLLDYGNSPIVGTTPASVDITSTVPPSGLLYVTIHLDYGLKGLFYGKDTNNNAVDPLSIATIIIPEGVSYTFEARDTSLSDSQTLTSTNAFKHDPGIAGVVLNTDGTPMPNVKVQILDSKGKVLATLLTDNDGAYQWQYKYTGKPTSFTVKLPDYNLKTTVTFKSNGFIVVNFQLRNTITVISKWL